MRPTDNNLFYSAVSVWVQNLARGEDIFLGRTNFSCFTCYIVVVHFTYTAAGGVVSRFCCCQNYRRHPCCVRILAVLSEDVLDRGQLAGGIKTLLKPVTLLIIHGRRLNACGCCCKRSLVYVNKSEVHPASVPQPLL